MEKLFNITGKFQGHVAAVYNQDGLLLSITFSDDCSMNEEQRRWTIRNTAAHFDKLQYHEDAQMVVKEVLREITFDDFWNTYNKKVDKAKCEKIWSKLSKQVQLQAYKGIKGYETFLKREGWGRAKKDPATYLNQQTYTDYTN